MCLIVVMLKARQHVCAIVQLDPNYFWIEPAINCPSCPLHSLKLILSVSFLQSKSQWLWYFIFHLMYK